MSSFIDKVKSFFTGTKPTEELKPLLGVVEPSGCGDNCKCHATMTSTDATEPVVTVKPKVAKKPAVSKLDQVKADAERMQAEAAAKKPAAKAPAKKSATQAKAPKKNA